MADHLEELCLRLPEMAALRPELEAAVSSLEKIYSDGGKLLVCGNGGSAADAEHITAELMKGFLLKRPLTPSLAARLKNCPKELVAGLQMGFPAISLVGGVALPTAFGNDVCFEYGFAQQILNLGKPGDGLMCLSTSGNSRNILAAMQVGRGIGLTTIGLTGARRCEMAKFADILIAAPSRETPRIQEYHLAIYHALCAELEERLFGRLTE